VTFALPRTLTLPSGTRVTIEQTDEHDAPEPVQEAPMFGDVLALFAHDVRLWREEATGRAMAPLDVGDLPLADFHVLRGVVAKAGLVREEEVEIECHNCDEPIVVRPCEGLEVGPWEHGEADDPELDRTAAFGEPLPTRPISLGRVRSAHTVTLAARSVRDAMPLFAALGRDPLVIDEAVVGAMGITAVGPVNSLARIARALRECDEAALESVTSAFLEAHYPLRLACEVFCPKCKARNTIDAPALREFERAPFEGDRRSGAAAIEGGAEQQGRRPLPQLAEFVELAHAIADPLIAEIPGEKAELLVDDQVPAVDEGGEPLLGSYVPPPGRDEPVPTRPPTVTVYYRTFVAMEREEGPFDWDWEEELRETIEHELEHHVFFLRGDDPMDEAEHAEIDREALRVLGRTAATRRTLAIFGSSIPDFLVRAWPLVLIAAVVLAITLAEGRCAP
jgi:hypothetical protein